MNPWFWFVVIGNTIFPVPYETLWECEQAIQYIREVNPEKLSGHPTMHCIAGPKNSQMLDMDMRDWVDLLELQK